MKRLICCSRITLVSVSIVLFSVFSHGEVSAKFIWDDFEPSSYWQPAAAPPSIFQKHSEDLTSLNGMEVSLDVPKIRKLLLSDIQAGKSQTILYFPNAQGEMIAFVVEEKSNFSPVLAAKFPEITAYIGFAIGDPSLKVHFSTAPSGLEAVISNDMSGRRTNIKKLRGTQNYRVTSNYTDLHNHDEFSCSTEVKASPNSFKGFLTSAKESSANGKKSAFSNTNTLSKYRLAVSANGQYTQYHGGTVRGALAAINATMTNVNAIFERDFGITLEIIDNNELIIYTDAATDPYSDDTNALNGELQSNLNNVIGSENYDHGHIFSAINGGMSGNAGAIGGFCNDESKGSAWSDSPRPEGYDFTFLVAHEIGHQLGANHTFSMRSEGTGKNVEPGSGTTVMSYAGITGANNVAIASDDYFHHVSIEQSLNYLQGQSCHADIPNENSLPVIDQISDVSVPILTPFILEGAASDADQDDVLSYTWEQIDDGNVTFSNFGPSQQTGATFRSLPPSGTAVRYMPSLSSVLSGNLTLEDPSVSSTWETLSATPRDLNFGFTVRDNAVGGGGVTLAKMKVSVIDNGGAFAITSPISGHTYLAGSSHTVTWNVAGTNKEPIKANTVTITLSVDGGRTYPYTLAENVANAGSYDVVLPDFVTEEARVRIQPDNNIFYTVNDQNISLTRRDMILSADESDYIVCSDDSINASLVYGTSSAYNDIAVLSASNLPTDLSVTFSPSVVASNNSIIDATISAAKSIAPGSYPISLHATSEGRSQSVDLRVQAYSTSFTPIDLLSPLDRNAIDMFSTTLSWRADANAEQYQVEVSVDRDFTEILQSVETSLTSHHLTALNSSTTYYWRVVAQNRCNSGVSANVFSFSTPNYTQAQDLPILIPAGSYYDVYTSVIEIQENQRINDLNVLVDISMEQLFQLNITLTSPSGTMVELFDQSCGDNQDMQVIFDDQADAFSCGGSGTSPNLSGRQKPQNDLLSRFNEQSTQGSWTLTVEDLYNQNVQDNSINGFALEISTDAGVEYQNFPPIAFDQFHPIVANQETTISLDGLDPEGSPLSYRLITEANGSLKNFSPRQLGNWTDSDGSHCGVSDLLLIDDDTTGISSGYCNLTVLDVRDPSNITVIAEIEADDDSFSSAVVSSDETMIFVGVGNAGLKIYDISERGNIVSIGTYDTPTTARGVVLSHDEKTAFVPDRSYQLQIIDVNDPSDPSLLGTFDTYGAAVDVALSPDGNTLHIVDWFLLINVDVSDPANPELLGYVNTQYDNSETFIGGYSDSLVISSDGQIAYVESSEYGLVVVDISDLNAPTVMSSLNLGIPNSSGNSSKLTLSPDGKSIFLAGDTIGLMIVDVSNPLNPILMNKTQTLGDSFGVTLSNAGDKLYLSSRARTALDGSVAGAGLTIFNVEKQLISADELVSPAVYYLNSMDSSDSDSFSFKVNDGLLDSEVATVNLTITESAEANTPWAFVKNNDGTITISGCSGACASNLTIPETINGAIVTGIANYAFANSGISSVVLPESITNIGHYAFYSNLITSITFGSNIDEIGIGAFSYNTLLVASFLGHRPSIGLDAFKLNREIISITYCDDTNGWPGNDISNGLTSIRPTSRCDAAAAHSSALTKIETALSNSDASGLTLDDFEALIGVTGANQVYLNQYLTFIGNTSSQKSSLADIQYIIASVNETMSSCPSSAYFSSVTGSNPWPWEISWDLIQNDNPDVPKLSGDAKHISLSCLEAGRYTLNMYDSWGDGWVDNYGTIDTFFTIWKSDGGDNIVREGLTSGFYGKANVNLGDYSNVAPRADNQTIEVIRGVPKRLSLLAIDEDLDRLDLRLASEPVSGSLYSGLSIESLGAFSNPSKVYDLALSSSHSEIYLASGNTGLSVIDITNLSSPELISAFDTDGLTRAIALSSDGNAVFLADGTRGLKIVNVSDAASPELIGQLEIGESVYDIELSNGGNLLYAVHLSGTSVVDISDPSNPLIVSTLPSPGDAQAIALSKDGTLAYVGDGYEGFHIIDISEATELTLIKSVDTPGEIYSLSLSSDDSLLYLADGSYGFKVFNVKDPADPKLIASLDNIGFVRSVEVSSDGFSVYLATSRSVGPLIVDVTDSQHPTLLSTSGYSDRIEYVIPSLDEKRAFALTSQSIELLNLNYTNPFTNGAKIGASVVYLTTSDTSNTDMFKFIANDGRLDSDAARVEIIVLDDADGDRVPDRDDAFPNDVTESIDTDGDGVGNNADNDDDGDGVIDIFDHYPLISLDGLVDTDGDGKPNNCDDSCLSLGMTADNDDDADGVSDENDVFPLDTTETLDTDFDGIGNNADTDDDGDGVADTDDAFPLDANESADSDNDGVGDNADIFPNDSTETLDSDEDGLGDNADSFPNDGRYQLDSDGDGMPDAWETKYGLDPNDPADATSDVDNDGVSALDEFLADTHPFNSIDIDGNQQYDALTDGLLLLRGMFGLDGSALVTGTVAPDAAYTESIDIESRIDALDDLADIDGNGQIDALTDGLLMLRYLFGLEGDTLINGVIAQDATRTSSADIEAHLRTLMP